MADYVDIRNIFSRRYRGYELPDEEWESDDEEWDDEESPEEDSCDENGVPEEVAKDTERWFLHEL